MLQYRWHRLYWQVVALRSRTVQSSMSSSSSWPLQEAGRLQEQISLEIKRTLKFQICSELYSVNCHSYLDVDILAPMGHLSALRSQWILRRQSEIKSVRTCAKIGISFVGGTSFGGGFCLSGTAYVILWDTALWRSGWLTTPTILSSSQMETLPDVWIRVHQLRLIISDM